MSKIIRLILVFVSIFISPRKFDFTHAASMANIDERTAQHFGGAKDCHSKYGDEGHCLSESDCNEIRGIPTGICSSNKFQCCHSLSCSLETLERLNSTRTRRKRSIINKSLITMMEPACGLRISRRVNPRFSRQKQLINGQDLNDIARFPWMLGVWKKSQLFHPRGFLPTCGAALISLRHALTAAHCVNDHKSVTSYILRGASILNRLTFMGGSIIPIKGIDVHPDFNPFTFENDIAVITFEKEIVQSTNLFPICLPPPVVDGQYTKHHGTDVSVTGWGCTDENCDVETLSRILQEVVMEVIPNDVAMCWFMNDNALDKGIQEYIPQKIFITGGDESGEKATCQGDSGSPVVRTIQTSFKSSRFEIIGLVSWSKGCGREFRPSVWTRVETFVPWIKEQMSHSCLAKEEEDCQ